jgi:dihydroneopterin aldolase
MNTDLITLRGLTFFGRHGANPEETSLGQRFGLDLTVWLDLSTAARTDHLDDTVSYSALYKLVRAEMEGEPSQLLEHLAARVLRVVLHHDPRIKEGEVTVTKLSPPLKGSTTGNVSITMRRDSGWLNDSNR